MKSKYEYNKEWRYRHPEKRYSGKQRYYSKTAFAPNGGQPLSPQEIKCILAHDIPDSELSKVLGRSVGAIQKARWRHKTNKQERQKEVEG